MRFATFIFLFLIYQAASAQFRIPAYTVVHDSATHITVKHSGNDEIARLGRPHRADTMQLISPRTTLPNGVVDHKSVTGEMIVREYYVDKALIGYIEFDRSGIRREVYYNAQGNIYLEKQYDNGSLKYTNTRLQVVKRR